MRLDYKRKHLFAFSDTHGMHRKLSIPKDTDILICAGDIVSDFQENGLSDFFDWFSSCPAQLRLFVPGNHEIIFDLYPEEARQLMPANVTLLEDSGVEYDGITFYAISSRMIQQMQWLGRECGLPYKTDVLITHIPSKGILDENMGSEVLKQIILERQPKHHLFGHVHSKGGLCEEKWSTKFDNVSTFQALCKTDGQFELLRFPFWSMMCWHTRWASTQKSFNRNKSGME